MVTAIQKLQVLRARKQDQIAQWKREIAELENKIREMGAVIGGIDASMDELTDHESENFQPVESPNRFNGKTLTESVLNIIQMAGAPEGLLPKEIVDALVVGGFKSKTDNLYASVYPICVGLAKNEKVKLSEKNGKKSFARLQPF